MAITLQNPDLDQRLQLPRCGNWNLPEALAEKTLTRYFAATAELGAMLEERLREVEDGRVDAVDGEPGFARLRERSRNAQ